MWKASFDKTDLTKTNPDVLGRREVQFAGLVARPIVPYYTKLSTALQVAIQKALKGQDGPQQALDGSPRSCPFQK